MPRQETGIANKNVILHFLTATPEQHSELISYLQSEAKQVTTLSALRVQDKPDVILIEANFGYFKILKFLKRLKETESTATIVLMGPALEGRKISALLRSGVFDYLNTPFPLRRLGKVIQKGLKNRAALLDILALSERLSEANQSLLAERDQLRSWNANLSQLYDLNQRLSESLHIDEIVKASLSNIKKVVAYDIAGLYLEGWKQVRVVAEKEKWGALIEKVKEETRCDGAHFVETEDASSLCLVRHAGSEIMVPLSVGLNKIGLLRLIRLPDIAKPGEALEFAGQAGQPKEPFSEEQCKLLSMIAAPLSIAIRNADIYRQVEDLAVKDPLTGILNRRAFSSILDREFGRANRYKNAVSLMVIDIDFFKKVNDTHGHLAGDQVLREVAQILKTSLRDIDVPIRFGGEEFVLILPGTNLRESLIVAARIKDRVQAHIFYEETQAIRVTVSIGVACYPSKDIRSPNALFKQADEALYTAKRNGRNRIMILKSAEDAECDLVSISD